MSNSGINATWPTIRIYSTQETSHCDEEKTKSLSTNDCAKKTNYAVIIHSIVMEKFEPKFNSVLQRSFRRRHSSTTNSERLLSTTCNTNTESTCNSVGSLSDLVDSGLDEAMQSTPKFPRVKKWQLESCHSSCNEEDCLEDFRKEFLTKSQLQRDAELNDNSMGTTDVSSLISSRNTIFQNNKPRKLSPVRHIEEEIELISNYPDYYDVNPRMEQLSESFSKLDQTILQVSKLLSLCQRNLNSVETDAYIEAEKILLETVCKKELLQKEINKTEYDHIDEYENVAKVNITKIKCDFKNTGEKYSGPRKFKQCFLCILSTEKDVLTSNVLLTDTEGLLVFDKTCSFQELPADFQINLNLYCLDVPDFDQKKTKHCLKTNRFFTLRRTKSYKNLKDLTNMKSSAFVLMGKTTITISDLKRNKQYKFNSMSWPNCKYFTIEMNAELNLKSGARGFLNVGVGEQCTLWNRRWCVLQDYHFMYWNYPSDETVSEPVGRVDMRYCMNYNITTVKRCMCSRPRTLFMEILKEPAKIVHYLLSADTQKDFKEWEDKLNATVTSLHNWDKMKCQTSFPKK